MKEEERRYGIQRKSQVLERGINGCELGRMLYNWKILGTESLKKAGDLRIGYIGMQAGGSEAAC